MGELGVAVVVARDRDHAPSLAELRSFATDRLAGYKLPEDVRLVDARIGVRPMPADNVTIAGRVPGLANAWMLATHSGMTLGPLLGRLIADEIVTGASSPMLAPFRPDRFA